MRVTWGNHKLHNDTYVHSKSELWLYKMTSYFIVSQNEHTWQQMQGAYDSKDM
jgi:hypothetical protein